MDCILLKAAAPYISLSLSHVINLTIIEGVLPVDFKTARVTPIYKGQGSLTEPGNYRPISVVSTITKLLETAVKEQLMNYLTVNNIITDVQFAYIKNMSTQFALHVLVDDFLKNINNGKMNGLVQLDLQKGFDTLSHPILIHKLRCYGFTDNSLCWFRSYLENRTQITRCKDKISKPATVNIGVPQGTVLGPIIFLLYVNDLPSYLNHNSCIMYADDTSLKSSADDHETLQTNLQFITDATVDWLNKNRLLLNVKKSSCMLIGTKQRISGNDNLKIMIGDDMLTQCSHTKLIGIELDSYLDWIQHVDTVAKKISRKLGFLKRLKLYLNSHLLNTVYISLIQSQFDYCLTVWGSCSKYLLLRLQRLQNRAARIITGIYDYNVSASELVKSLGWVSLEKRCAYFTAITVFKCINKNAPVQLSQSFNFISDYHDVNTRSSSNYSLHVPKPNLELFKTSLVYRGSKIWNDLPLNVKQSVSLESFKSLYNSVILNGS